MVIVVALGADILAGDLFIAKTDDSSKVVCQVRCVIFPWSLEVVLWRESNDAPPLCLQLHKNLLRSNVRELYAEAASSVILCSNVVDIAFVFQAEVLEHFWIDISGMTRVLFMRSAGHVAFSPNVVEIFPSCIWYSLFILKDQVCKLLSSKG